MKRINNIAGVTAGIAGAALVLVLFFAVRMSIAASIVLGIAGFAGVYLLVISLRPVTKIVFERESGITAELVESTLREGEEKIRMLERYAKQVKSESVKQKIQMVISIVQEIFGSFRKDPKDIKHARQFLVYYFDATIRIVRKYIDLSSQPVRSPEIERALLKAENILGSIGRAFEKQQARILRDDAMDLDVEIETLERSFRSEDLK